MAEPNHTRRGRLRIAVLGMTTAAILALINLQIADKERIVNDGTTVLLRLAPADPRSLLQGDYMALRYAMASRVDSAARDASVDDGTIIIELDERQVAHFAGLHDGRELDENEHLLRFRKRGRTVRLASDAYFFQEGQAAIYGVARFGELRVSDNGEAVLVGLRDDDLQRLGKSLFPGESMP